MADALNNTAASSMVSTATTAPTTSTPSGTVQEATPELTVNTAGTKQSFTDANLVPNQTSTNINVNLSGVPGQGMESVIPKATASTQVQDNGDYWWNSMSKDMAYNQYQQDKQTAITNSLGARQNIEKNAATAMENFFLESYTTAQQVDKAGWTGGYVLDADRQLGYLKATIAADLYGQMELQKAGFDAQLAQARLAYDSNQKQLALQYYKDATQMALQEAEVTGFYLPPEAKENLNQQKMANDILSNSNSTPEQRAKAQKVITAVDTWFSNQGISKQGQKTLARIQYEETVRANQERERLQQLEIDTNIRIAREANESAERIARLTAESNERMNDATNASNERMNQANIDASKALAAASAASTKTSGTTEKPTNPYSKTGGTSGTVNMAAQNQNNQPKTTATEKAVINLLNGLAPKTIKNPLTSNVYTSTNKTTTTNKSTANGAASNVTNQQK